MKQKLILPLGLLVLCVVMGTACGGPSRIEVRSVSVTPNAEAIQPVLNVFIENSGSMDGYMCDGSQLKDVVYDYVSELNRYTESTHLYYINKEIIPFTGSLESYIKHLNPTAFRQAGGNRSNSDIGAMIEAILGQTSDSTISLFVSDCILDLPAGKAQNFLMNRQIQIKNTIIDRLKVDPDFGIEILKFTSDFKGKYFYPTGGFTWLTGVKRPYYIWILGSKQLLAQLKAEASWADLEKYGLEGTVSFTTASQVPAEIKNRSLASTQISLARGGYPATILADFRPTLRSTEEIQNPANYTFSQGAITVEGIFPIRNQTSPYTHYIQILIPKEVRTGRESLYFNLPPLPDWIAASNDTTGVEIEANLDKTTGIRSLIQGVADAYRKTPYAANFEFTITYK